VLLLLFRSKIQDNFFFIKFLKQIHNNSSQRQIVFIENRTKSIGENRDFDKKFDTEAISDTLLCLYLMLYKWSRHQ